MTSGNRRPLSAVVRMEPNRILTVLEIQNTNIFPSWYLLRSADATYNSLGIVVITSCTPSGMALFCFKMDIVLTYLTRLIGMDVFEMEDMITRTVSNRLLNFAPHANQHWDTVSPD